MNMDIQQQSQEWTDIFGIKMDNQDSASNDFSLKENEGVNLFNESAPVEPATVEPLEPVVVVEDDGAIFMHDEDKAKLGRKPKYNFNDISGYFEDRIKNKKFVPIEEERDGKTTSFIPKTPEEFDEFIDLQLNHKFLEREKEVEERVYESKSPAWKTILKYSELTDDINEVLPFLQGVQNIESISNIDPTEEIGAERIVRYKMSLNGDTEDLIVDQIEALKQSNKLISTGERLKPLLVQQEQQRLSQLQNDKINQTLNYQRIVDDYRTSAISEIEKPIFNQKLKKEEQALIYELIAQPDAKQGGYAIYSAIDKMYETRDFESLKMIALLTTNKDKFLEYIKKEVTSTVAENLQRKLKVASSTPISTDYQLEQRQAIQPIQQRESTQNGFRRF